MVSLGRTARTSVHEDATGIVTFVFDITPAEKQSAGNWTLHLDGRALGQTDEKFNVHGRNTAPAFERIAAARGRVREFAASCGYIVVVEQVAHP
jgi:hypothetical protein